MSESKEQLDSEGTTLRVANLIFLEGTLGQGAYGTVRLARRMKPCEKSNHDSSPALSATEFRHPTVSRSMSPPPESTFLSNDYSETSATRAEPLENKRITRSVSAPASDDFFKLNKHEQIIYGTKSRLRSRALGHRNRDDSGETDLVAVKIFQKSILKRIRTMERHQETRQVKVKTALEKVEREIAIMKKLSHPNLVSFYEVIDSPESDLLYLCLEFMEGGEILTYYKDGMFRRDDDLDGLVNGHFDEYHSSLYFVDILHGLAYLHQHHIIHRDIKPQNVLLDARGIAKLSDFGVSHIFDDSDTFLECPQQSSNPQRLTRHDTDTALSMKGMPKSGLITKTEGTWAFWSPEMCRGDKAFSGYAADLWAAGVCLYVFVSGKLPFYSDVPLNLMDAIKSGEVPYEGLQVSDGMLELLRMTLEPDPLHRAGVGDCLKHPALLLARAQRVQQLGVELERSKTTRIEVGEQDLRSAFRIVTALPAVLLKTATKQLQEGFHAAKQRLSSSSVSRSASFSDRGSRGSSFGNSGGAATTPCVNGSIQESEAESNTASLGEVDSPFRHGFSSFFSPRGHGNSTQLEVSSISTPKTPSKHSHLPWIRNRESDVSMTSEDGSATNHARIPIFYKKRLSDMSATSEEDEDAWPRTWGFLRRRNEGDRSFPGSLRNRLLALKGSSRDQALQQTSNPGPHETDHRTNG